MKYAFRLMKHEHHWLPKWLEPFEKSGWFDTVLYRVRSGKEAVVYCCEAKPETGFDLLAAKVYLPPKSRASKYHDTYNLGRDLLDSEGQPIRQKRYNNKRKKRVPKQEEKRQTNISWVQHEYQTQQLVFSAGAKVPQPLAVNDNALLTTYIGNRRLPAPTLQRTKIHPTQAGNLFIQLLEQMALFLSQDRIHSDLSSYNILYHNNDFTIIDFPQAINAQTHPKAFYFLHRDVKRLCDYFSKFELEADARAFARALWGKYKSGELAQSIGNHTLS